MTTAMDNLNAGAAPARKISAPMLIAAGALLAFIGALFYPPAAFSIDEALYIEMAHAMASRGAFDITPPNLPDGAPVLAKSDGLVHIINGRAIPQYPGLYGVIAAPFFLLMGVKGLAFLNALCAVFCLLITHRIAFRLTTDEWTARAAVAMLAGASIFGGYIFAVWPHMLALLFILAGAYAVLLAVAEHKNTVRHAALAGLWFGFGVGVRVDVILAGIASFFWLRLFAKPSERLPAIALLAGLVPGLCVAGAINYAKFGAFNPFSYGASEGGVALSTYFPLIAVVIGAAGAALLFDITAKPFAGIIKKVQTAPAPAKLAAIIAAMLLGLLVFLPKLAYGLHILLVDIQGFKGPARPGLEKTVYGYWDFWGQPKKALLQSMPWLALALAPLWAFVNAKRTKETGYLLLLAAAPVFFFALKAWYGGMSYNMRYYLPAVPFLAILCAQSLSALRPQFKKHERLLMLSAGAGVAIAFGAYVLGPAYGPQFSVPMQLYPQLVLSAALAIAIFYTLFRPANASGKTIAAGLAAVTLAQAGLISVFDMHGYFASRAQYVPYTAYYKETVPAGAAVFTKFDELLIDPAMNGAAVIRVNEASADDISKTITAYYSAERCIFVHTHMAAEFFAEDALIELVMPASTPARGLALFVHKDSPAQCRSDDGML